MGTTLTGTTPQDTYDSLIKVTDNGPLSGTAKYLSDGLGNDSKLALSTGNIGIGTTSPSTTLHLDASGGATIRLQRTSASANRFDVGTDGTNMEFNVRDTGAFTFGGGNVGIGTSSPTAMLTLKSTSPFIRIERDGVPHWQIQNNTLVNDAGFSINNATNVATPFFINGTTNQVGILNANPLQPLDVTGNIRTSTGILFGSDTAAANLLDDYEEGTFTPTVEGSTTAGTATYVSRVGIYTKIGRIVKFSITVNYNSGTGAGNLRIANLPFTSLSAVGGGANSSCSIGAFGDIALSASNVATAFVPNGTQFIVFEQYATGGSSSAAVPYDAAGVIIVSGTYEV